MTIADILTFIGIVVSIIFGFFITHYCSIRDTRTRVLKDYYIDQIKGIKGRIDKFFHSVAFGKSSFQKVVNWYGHISIDIVGIDKGVRKCLDLQISQIIDLVDRYYGEITSWDDYNNQYSSSSYNPSNEHRETLLKMKHNCDEFLNDYINHINQANNYPIWKVQYRRIKKSYTYYGDKGRLYAILRAIWERIEKHLFECTLIIAIIWAAIFLYHNIEIDKKDDIVTPLNNISCKQDSIFKELQLLRDKYSPVEVQTKTFNNSSFFNADKIDSVHIELYKGEPKLHEQ